ncbi:MAG: TTAGGG repeat binding factor [Alyxoria varia]|nr:MAG: TTAGGG repeat binding factor [Alyxoria varia]
MDNTDQFDDACSVHIPQSQKRSRSMDRTELAPSPKRFKSAEEDGNDHFQTNGSEEEVSASKGPDDHEYDPGDHLRSSLFGTLESTAIAALTTIENTPPPQLSYLASKNQSDHPHPLHSCQTILKGLVEIFEPSNSFIGKDTIYTYSLEQQSALRRVNLALVSLNMLFWRVPDVVMTTRRFLDIFDIGEARSRDQHLDFLLELRLQLYALHGSLPALNDTLGMFMTDLDQETTDLITENDFEGKYSKAKHLVDQDPEQNSPSWNHFIHCLKDYIRKSLEVFDEEAESWARIRLAATAAHRNPNSRSENEENVNELRLQSAQQPYGQDYQAQLRGPSATAAPQVRTGQLKNVSMSSQEVYRTARLHATMAEHEKKTQITNSKSSRRVWNRSEENALLDGLDRVGGPYWSRILALHGAGGTISEILKDRTQVQLKDKARNLKLWFLKERPQEVPNSLKHVTGDLKRTIQARAAKDEVKADGYRPVDENSSICDVLDTSTLAQGPVTDSYGPWESQADGSQIQVAPHANMTNTPITDGNHNGEELEEQPLDAKETAERALQEANFGSIGTISV